VNKKVLLIVIIVLLLLVAGGAFFMLTKKPSSQLANSNPVPTSAGTQSVPTASAARSLRDLLTQGLPQKCTFSMENTTGSGTGMIVISGGKVRGEITSTIDGQTTLTHMLVDGTTSYIWMGDNTTGFKMSIDPKTITPAPNQPKSAAFDPDKSVNYNCTPWVPDASQFVLPANVTFSDLSKSVMIAPSGAAGPATDKCAACSYLTGDAKTQCLSALGCK
jgi:hypothetical protein